MHIFKNKQTKNLFSWSSAFDSKYYNAHLHTHPDVHSHWLTSASSNSTNANPLCFSATTLYTVETRTRKRCFFSHRTEYLFKKLHLLCYVPNHYMPQTLNAIQLLFINKQKKVNFKSVWKLKSFGTVWFWESLGCHDTFYKTGKRAGILVRGLV